MSEPRVPTVISIAGSDSGGGAGIQADLKAFARCGVHGTTAITAITAQNTLGVEAVVATPPEMIVAQVRAVASDIGIDAVKIGMLGDEATIDAVVESLGVIEKFRREVPIVLDPVMVAESGALLLDPEAKVALIERLLPLVTVATPNMPEARELAGRRVGGIQRELGEAILALGPDAVIVTGGHTEKGADVLVDANGFIEIEGPRFADGAAHGSGCTHSSSVAALLARGMELDEAARWAREIAAEAVGHGLREIGKGPGPVDVLRIRRREIDPPRLDEPPTRRE
jgi:hydroxymethylpyrimidine/phosphomethylpyrimidine kinase